MSLIELRSDQQRVVLKNPADMRDAAAYLWNRQMMLHVNCRGYVVAQHMQPEPAKYAHAPNLEAKTFMQPEQPYYAHHPGRFFYLKDRDSGEIFSLPYAPVKKAFDHFEFSAGQADIAWSLKMGDLHFKLTLRLHAYQVVELWQLEVINKGDKRNLDLYAYFPVGYMSWMNQSADILKGEEMILCSAVTPYQKYPEYDKIKNFKDKTFLAVNRKPVAFESIQADFEGEGGLNCPDALKEEQLKNGEARYETPICAMQFRLEIESEGAEDFRFCFGPVRNAEEALELKKKFLTDPDGFEKAERSYQKFLEEVEPRVGLSSADPRIEDMVNHWLPRQVFYHGTTNRLTTDPQTRNYLQDNMGMVYLDQAYFEGALRTALKQQNRNGSMPDGILIHESAELKYINQVPHTDHCVWLPVVLQAYLDESGNYDFLEEELPFADDQNGLKIYEHLDLAMDWLLKTRDDRGLSFIEQGDWCDPMNMVGYKGRGVSGWLSIATVYALKLWSNVCLEMGRSEKARHFEKAAQGMAQAIDRYFWSDQWYGRGITDDDVLFGIASDPEGSIFLNPQAWAMLAELLPEERLNQVIQSVEERLEGPYGVEMLAPAFTAMRDDVGRVTQKFPGSAENGSVYNHAACFYIFALYQSGKSEKAFDLFQKMIPGPDQADYVQRGQLPVFIPNYYRGAYRQFSRTAGRSSQLFNTGTASWMYRILIESLLGLKGCRQGLFVDPQLPKSWTNIKVRRLFRNKEIRLQIKREEGRTEKVVLFEGKALDNGILPLKAEQDHYEVIVLLPEN